VALGVHLDIDDDGDDDNGICQASGHLSSVLVSFVWCGYKIAFEQAKAPHLNRFVLFRSIHTFNNMHAHITYLSPTRKSLMHIDLRFSVQVGITL